MAVFSVLFFYSEGLISFLLFFSCFSLSRISCFSFRFEYYGNDLGCLFGDEFLMVDGGEDRRTIAGISGWNGRKMSMATVAIGWMRWNHTFTGHIKEMYMLQFKLFIRFCLVYINANNE